jgi:DNA polymerase-1
MTIKTRTLGVDGNWVLHRAFHTQNYEAKDPGAIILRNFVSIVSKDALNARATRVLVGFDGSRIFRHKLYPEYKANRPTPADGRSPYDYLEGLLQYLGECGIPYRQHHKYEADDLMCTLKHVSEGPVWISSKDKDSYQYVDERVTLIDSTAKPEPRILRYKDIERVFGVRPELALDLQTLIGDTMDNVPQLMSRAKAVKGLKEWGSLKKWMSGDREVNKILSKSKDQLILNRKLVKLVKDIPDVEASVPKWNSSKEMPNSYIVWKDFANPKSRGLF